MYTLILRKIIFFICLISAMTSFAASRPFPTNHSAGMSIAEDSNQSNSWLWFNHHIHNFDHGNLDSNVAVEFGYTGVLIKKAAGADYDDLKIIFNSNGRACPIKLKYDNSGDGTMYVCYHEIEGQSGTDSKLATLNGLSRTAGDCSVINGPGWTELRPEDWNLVLGYAHAIYDPSGLNYNSVTMDDIKYYFDDFWCSVDGNEESCSLTVNFASKAVVSDVIQIFTENFDENSYDGVFFDGMGLQIFTRGANASWGGEGTYATWSAGKVAAFEQVVPFLKARGKKISINIWNPSLFINQIVWGQTYADGTVRFDHYYYEQGGLGTQAPNGLDPETGLPAYTDGNTPPNTYIPANRVALDDEYSYAPRNGNYDANYSIDTHFNQHLDACGTAGKYGAWFGWYGEDNVALTLDHDNNVETAKVPIFTNDLQLLRAISNWDNIAEIPLDNRIWENKNYQSSNSYASADVIYSINPINKEMYVVFRSLDGSVELPAGVKIETAYFSNEFFGKTLEDALPAMDIHNGTIRLKSSYDNKLLTGIRITFSKPESPKNLYIKAMNY